MVVVDSVVVVWGTEVLVVVELVVVLVEFSTEVVV